MSKENIIKDPKLTTLIIKTSEFVDSDILMQRVGNFFMWLRSYHNYKRIHKSIDSFLTTEFMVDSFIAFQYLDKLDLQILLTSTGNILFNIREEMENDWSITQKHLYGSVEIQKNKSIYTVSTKKDITNGKYVITNNWINDHFNFLVGIKPIQKDLIYELLRKSAYDILPSMVKTGDHVIDNSDIF